MSNVKDSGTTPAVDQRPIVTFSPALPVIEAGMRTEPAVSLPNASKAEPSRRLTPAPLDEPPTERCAAASHGLYGAPWWLFCPAPPNANSTMWVLPMITPSWRRSVATSGPSRSQGSAGRRRLDPAKQGYPLAANRSFSETGNPWRGPAETPAANAASAASATARACSGAQNE